MSQLKVRNDAPAEAYVRLKPHTLGRHYHRVPAYLRDMLHKHPQVISDYFLSSFRVNLEFQNVKVYEQPPRAAQCQFRSRYGRVGFAMDRSLLAESLEAYYGGNYSPRQDPPESISEHRLRARIGVEVLGLFARTLLGGQSFGELSLFDHTYSETQWECIVELNFQSHTAEQPATLIIYLDEQMLDLLTSRMAAPSLAPEPANLMEQVLKLPVQLTCVVARVQLPLAEVSALKPGDILPIRMAERCDVTVRQQRLFRGALTEEDGALFLTSLERVSHHD